MTDDLYSIILSDKLKSDCLKGCCLGKIPFLPHSPSDSICLPLSFPQQCFPWDPFSLLPPLAVGPGHTVRLGARSYRAHLLTPATKKASNSSRNRLSGTPRRCFVSVRCGWPPHFASKYMPVPMYFQYSLTSQGLPSCSEWDSCSYHKVTYLVTDLITILTSRSLRKPNLVLPVLLVLQANIISFS